MHFFCARCSARYLGVDIRKPCQSTVGERYENHGVCGFEPKQLEFLSQL